MYKDKITGTRYMNCISCIHFIKPTQRCKLFDNQLAVSARSNKDHCGKNGQHYKKRIVACLDCAYYNKIAHTCDLFKNELAWNVRLEDYKCGSDAFYFEPLHDNTGDDISAHLHIIDK